MSQYALPMGIFGLISVATLVGAILIALVDRWGFGWLGRFAVSGLIACGLIVYALAWRRARRRREIYRSALPAEPEEVYRLRCVGAPEELQPHGEFADVPFEPRIFYASLAVLPSKWTQVVAWITASLICLVLAFSPTGIFGVRLYGPATVWLPFGVVVGVVAWLCPSYFRIVPGCLDVLRYSPFQRKPTRVEKYDLRTARILVDLRRSVLFIDAPERSAEFSFLFVPGRARFAYWILLAAISTHTPAVLPEDELLG